LSHQKRRNNDDGRCTDVNIIVSFAGFCPVFGFDGHNRGNERPSNVEESTQCMAVYSTCSESLTAQSMPRTRFRDTALKPNIFQGGTVFGKLAIVVVSRSSMCAAKTCRSGEAGNVERRQRNRKPNGSLRSQKVAPPTMCSLYQPHLPLRLP
jgi:hypothetical protein